MKKLLPFIFTTFAISNTFAQDHGSIKELNYTTDSLFVESAEEVIIISTDEIPKHRRLKAAIFTLLLGPFGAHRLYLGTNYKVPLFYSLTLGGGLGIIPLIDFFHIVFSKDFEAYLNNPKFFMWIKDEAN